MNNRDDVMKHLGEQGIGCGIHYPVALPVTPGSCAPGLRGRAVPGVVGIADKIVSLPMHADLTDEQVDFVIQEVKKVAK
ncbi:MAG: DegT/DnrJ/EryC1/StrS family aminotransferase [bacterium]|nr:DegT/DnrJ/EryC1/StrS family aminotransferase [bacterium]